MSKTEGIPEVTAPEDMSQEYLNSQIENLGSRRNQSLSNREKSWGSSDDQPYVSRERSWERGRFQDQTGRDWTPSGGRSRNVKVERNYWDTESSWNSRDFQSSRERRESDRHCSRPYTDRTLNPRYHYFESSRERESCREYCWDSLNVERNCKQKEGHNQLNRKRHFSEDFERPSNERKSSVSGKYYLQETKTFREDQASYFHRPEDPLFRLSSPNCYQGEKAPVRRFSNFERSHTPAQSTSRPLNLHSEDPQNMHRRIPLANSHGTGFTSQVDRDVYLAKELVKKTCSSGGELQLDVKQWEQFCIQVIGTLPSGDMDAFFHRFPHIFSCEPDPTYRLWRVLRVKTTIELCEDYCSKGGCKRLICEGLHCCKFFLYDTCKFNQKCKFGHSLNDNRNRQLLTKHLLDMLTPSQIGILLRSGKVTQMFPKVCKFYNVDGGCQYGEKCHAMHICRHYLLDDCKFGRNCKRSHNIYDTQPKKILLKHGIPVDRSPKQVLEELRAVVKKNGSDVKEDYSDGEVRSSDSDDSDEFLGAVGPAPQRSRRRSSSCDSTSSGTKDSLEICTFFLREKCSYGNACANKHPQYGTPYLWQYEVGREWRNIERSSNDEIELNFSDPEKSECFTNNLPTGMMEIDFEAMEYQLTNGERGNVRRLSTKSSQGRATNFLYLTQWQWYLKDPTGRWKEFGKHGDKSIASDELEEEFSSNPNSHLQYSDDDGTEYVADLQNMKRKNRRSGSVRDIRRRPDMFDPNSKQPMRKRERRPSSPATNLSHMKIGTIYPKTWNLEFRSDNDYFQIVPVKRGEREFEDIQKLFNATVPGVLLKSVKRIQNAELWDAFYRKQTWMEKRLKPGGKLNVTSLFHGTKELYIDAICQQGFDWRISGSSSGTRYGKGSYFARKASYSHKFTDCRMLFVVQVLVGEFAQGGPTMVRPPPKDARQPFGELYDSAVDNPLDPNIFVVFTHEQAYPAYLIEY